MIVIDCVLMFCVKICLGGRVCEYLKLRLWSFLCSGLLVVSVF